MSFDFAYSYIGLFATSFISATLFPLGSEAMLAYMATLNKYSPHTLLFWASFGNTLGSCVNYYLGLNGSKYLIEKKYISYERMQKSQKMFEKYGIFTLMISWVPIIGDPITFIAGVLKYKFIYFLTIIAIAKTARYLALLMFV